MFPARAPTTFPSYHPFIPSLIFYLPLAIVSFRNVALEILDSAYRPLGPRCSPVTSIKVSPIHSTRLGSQLTPLSKSLLFKQNSTSNSALSLSLHGQVLLGRRYTICRRINVLTLQTKSLASMGGPPLLKISSLILYDRNLASSQVGNKFC
jgi:hypothetical protein